MNALRALADSPVIERLGWTLLHTAWQGLAVAIGLAVILPAVRKRGARGADAVCCGALLLTVLLPATTFLLLPNSSRIRPASHLETTTSFAKPAGQTAETADRPAPSNLNVATDVRTSGTDKARPESFAADASPGVGMTAEPSLSERAASFGRQIVAQMSVCLPSIVCVWILGVLGFSIWNLGGWFAAQRLKTKATRSVSEAVEQAAARIARRLGLARAVSVLQSALVDSPVVIGAIKPVILLPASLITELPPDQLESLLAHELAHVLRHDYLGNLLQSVVETLLFYHPAVWWISAQVRAERENCCDDLVLGVACDRAAYVRALAAVAGARAAILTPSASGGMLAPRLRRILGIVDPRPGHRAQWLAGAVILSLAGGLLLAAVRVQPTAVADEAAANQEPLSAVQLAEPGRTAKALLQLGTDRFRTREFITDIAFSPDGKLIAAASPNQPFLRAWLFDVQTGNEVEQIVVADKPEGWIQCLAFSPDQTKLLWGEIGGLVALWDRKAHRLLFREKLHEGQVNQVAFSRRGTLFASAGQDGEVQLRSAADPTKSVRTFHSGETVPKPRMGVVVKGPAGARCVAFLPDEKKVVVGDGSSGDISIFNVEDGALVQQMERAHGTGAQSFLNPKMNHLSVSSDGRQLMSSGQHTVSTADLNIKMGVTNVQVTEVRFWNIETGLLTREIKNDQSFGFGYAELSPDGKRVAVADFSFLRLLDAQTGKPLRTIEMRGTWGSQPRFSPDGKLVAMPMGNTIGLFDVQTGVRLHHDERASDQGIFSAAWSPRGDRIITGHGDGLLRVWNARTGELMWHKLLAPVISPSGWHSNPAFVAFTPDGRRIIAAGRRDDPVEFRNGIVAVFNAADGQLLRQAITNRSIRWGSLSPNGKEIVVGASNGSWDDTHLHGIEVETGRQLFVNPPEAVLAGFVQLAGIRFLPDSTSFVICTEHADFIRFNAMTGREIQRSFVDFRTPEQRRARRPKKPQIWEGDISRDGRTLVFCAAEFVYVWDVEAGMMLRKFRHPHQHGCHICVAPNGKEVATSDLQYAGDYGTDRVRVYDIESGAPILKADPEDRRAGVLAFSPDGTKLFTGYYRGTATVWDVRR